tara:strand:+ start:10354 stop:10824 length:471 start_codon:yes stop_codon:yes gene_type:complete
MPRPKVDCETIARLLAALASKRLDGPFPADELGIFVCETRKELDKYALTMDGQTLAVLVERFAEGDTVTVFRRGYDTPTTKETFIVDGDEKFEDFIVRLVKTPPHELPTEENWCYTILCPTKCDKCKKITYAAFGVKGEGEMEVLCLPDYVQHREQ